MYSWDEAYLVEKARAAQARLALAATALLAAIPRATGTAARANMFIFVWRRGKASRVMDGRGLVRAVTVRTVAWTCCVLDTECTVHSTQYILHTYVVTYAYCIGVHTPLSSPACIVLGTVCTYRHAPFLQLHVYVPTLHASLPSLHISTVCMYV